MSFRVLTVVGLVFVIGAFCLAGAATAESITECIVTETNIDCTERSVVTVPVSFGVTRNLEVLWTNPSTGISQTAQVEISKTQPRLFYPANPLHTVSYFPVEDPQPFEVNRPVECVSPNPLSQCFMAEEGPGIGGTCHCFNPGEVIFEGYELEGYGESFDVKLKVTQGSEQHTVKLNPANSNSGSVFYASLHDTSYMGSFDFRVALVDGGGRYASAPDLTNSILYIPVSPAGHPMVVNSSDNMLLVPREETTQDGRTCNRVGVGVEAFEAWVKAGAVGTCLEGQLFHKHHADLDALLLDSDFNARFLVSAKRPFKGSMDFYPGIPLERRLHYKVPEIAFTQVVLTLPRLDSPLTEVRTESQGIIQEARVKTFEALSNQGLLVVNIKNAGNFPTDYEVGVGECTMLIMGWGPNRGVSIPAQARTLAPDEEAELNFEVRALEDLETSNECLVTLRSPSGKEYDDVWVRFDTVK